MAINGYESDELKKQHIRALLEELAGYERLGWKEQADAVKKSLRAFGHQAAPKEKAERRPAADEKREKRA